MLTRIKPEKNLFSPDVRSSECSSRTIPCSSDTVLISKSEMVVTIHSE